MGDLCFYVFLSFLTSFFLFQLFFISSFCFSVHSFIFLFSLFTSFFSSFLHIFFFWQLSCFFLIHLFSSFIFPISSLMFFSLLVKKFFKGHLMENRELTSQNLVSKSLKMRILVQVSNKIKQFVNSQYSQNMTFL